MKLTTDRPQKPKGKRALTAEELRALAEYHESQEIDDKWHRRRDKAKALVGTPDRRWTSDAHMKTAGKVESAHRQQQSRQERRETGPSSDQLAEQQRRVLVRRRNRNRRLPWYAATGTLTVGMAGHGMSALFELTGASTPPALLGGVFAGVPALVTVGLWVRAERRYARTLDHADEYLQHHDGPPVVPTHRRWLPEAALGGIAGAGVAFWTSLAGITPAILLVTLVATCLLGARWWNTPDNRLGPGVPTVEPPRTQPTNQRAESEQPQRDEYAAAWKANLDLGYLTNRRDGDNAIAYDVELPRGRATYAKVQNSLGDIASALGLDLGQVFIEPPDKDQLGWRPANQAKLAIVTRDIAGQQRFYTGPSVQLAEDGSAAALTNLARFRDGRGEARLAMWNRNGMVSLAIFGGSGGGKSAAANVITCGALSTGLLNSIYVDFKGNSSSALRSRARIVVIGTDAVRDVQRLMKLLVDVRIANDPRDKQFPSAERPGWYVLMDEITKGIKGDPKFALQMEHLATTVRSLGIWLVATTQDMHSSAWNNTNTRAAFARQAVAFYMNTDSDDLINGLRYKPSQLPTYDQDDAELGEEAQPVAGFGVHANTYRPNVPCRWDWLPADDDPVDTTPPYRASAALDAFIAEPGIARDEYDALVAALGEPNEDGRWIIGTGGTHHFASEGKEVTAFNERRVRTGGFDAAGTPADADRLTDLQRRVLQLIESGTTKTGDLETALGDKASRATVNRALNDLVGANVIHRAAKGEYAAGPEPGA